VSEMLVHVEEEIIGYLKKKIDTSVAKGAIQPTNTEITSFLMFKLYISLVSDWERNHEPLHSEEIADVMKIFLVKGLSE
ncbi:MAG: TetR/AcrR family transcriptional regulator, partial [Bacillota bacterium]|nr:TetR/AcrR family transcriptional regulator [Bacillota bacterium]